DGGGSGARERSTRRPRPTRAVSALSLGGLEPQRDRVDAVAVVGGRRVALAVEDVPQVGVAARAADLGADHAVAAVLHQRHRVGVGRRVEARPAAVGLELGVRPEQLGAARPAAVDALRLGVDVLAGERALGARLAQHVELLRRELNAPLGLALDHLVHASSVRNAAKRDLHRAGILSGANSRLCQQGGVIASCQGARPLAGSSERHSPRPCWRRRRSPGRPGGAPAPGTASQGGLVVRGPVPSSPRSRHRQGSGTDPLSWHGRGLSEAAGRFTPMASPYIELEVGERTVKVTNPDKIYFPEIGDTKRDLVDYYISVDEGALRSLKDRPTNLKRHPDGVQSEAIYQKRMPAKRPDWVKTVTVTFPSGRTADSLRVTEVAAIAYCANLGTIDFHPWPVRASDVEHPD